MGEISAQEGWLVTSDNDLKGLASYWFTDRDHAGRKACDEDKAGNAWVMTNHLGERVENNQVERGWSTWALLQGAGRALLHRLEKGPTPSSQGLNESLTDMSHLAPLPSPAHGNERP